jgi:tyrosine-specific transport protein
MNSKGGVLGGALLVAGTSIGGGMLALPVLTSATGFLPSLLIYFLCWLFMAGTGLLFLEIVLWMKQESNIVSMAERTLGKGGKYFAWVMYLFLFYCLTLAYIVGCGDLVNQLFQGAVSNWIGSILFVIFFAPFIIAGARVIGPLNIVLMLGLALFYFMFVYLGYPHVKLKYLSHQNWSLSFMAFPIAFISFAYQGIIPTLAKYMDFDAKKIRKAIIYGSFIPFITYVIWEGLILGIIPTYGPGGLVEALQNGQNAVFPLKNFIDSAKVYKIGQFFAFFALLTSFLGVTLGLMDFLADGLKIKKTFLGKVSLCLLIFIPPLFFANIYPHLFLSALDYAGGIGSALLLGLLPILMVWSGRYKLGLQSPYSLGGGKPLLILMLVFVLFEMCCQIYITLGNF